MVRGIILCGGFGTRLLPITKIINKHCIPIYDKPMFYYPLATLVNAEIKEIMIVTGDQYMGDFARLLGNGEECGINVTYRIQKGAGGIADALALCEHFAGNDPIVVVLGDNIFEDGFREEVEDYEWDHTKAKVFLKEVSDPERFGVATIENNTITKIVEKPVKPESNLAVVGVYFYNNEVWNIIRTLKPSGRGELEISDVNKVYLGQNKLDYEILKGRWLDAGTPESLFKASEFVRENKSIL